jgi:hypothetical protein
VAYESKVLLASMAQILAKADSVEEAYNSLANIANVEGVILEPYQVIKKNQAKKSQDTSE